MDCALALTSMPVLPDVCAGYASAWTASLFCLMYVPGTVFCCMWNVTVLSVLAECHAAGIELTLPD